MRLKHIRYRTAAQSREPGYLKRRFEAIRRLQRMQARAATVTNLTERKKSHGHG
jgi:hypothetical protein